MPKNTKEVKAESKSSEIPLYWIQGGLTTQQSDIDRKKQDVSLSLADIEESIEQWIKQQLADQKLFVRAVELSKVDWWGDNLSLRLHTLGRVIGKKYMIGANCVARYRIDFDSTKQQHYNIELFIPSLAKYILQLNSQTHIHVIKTPISNVLKKASQGRTREELESIQRSIQLSSAALSKPQAEMPYDIAEKVLQHAAMRSKHPLVDAHFLDLTEIYPDIERTANDSIKNEKTRQEAERKAELAHQQETERLEEIAAEKRRSIDEQHRLEVKEFQDKEIHKARELEKERMARYAERWKKPEPVIDQPKGNCCSRLMKRFCGLLFSSYAPKTEQTTTVSHNNRYRRK